MTSRSSERAPSERRIVLGLRLDRAKAKGWRARFPLPQSGTNVHRHVHGLGHVTWFVRAAEEEGANKGGGPKEFIIRDSETRPPARK